VPGMVEALEERALKGGAPFLGICVGMQLLATVGREFGDTDGLDWIAGEVVKLEPDDGALKVPHMGWNELSFGDHPLFAGLEPGAHAYFVHSYQFRPRQPDERLAHVAYGGVVTAAVGRDNIAGVQFHPEKSQATGLRLIANFLNWAP
ncbi:MAG: imidazole glycerol phosphate synthase subunit HisH, partial [Pikeienuella sp.]